MSDSEAAITTTGGCLHYGPCEHPEDSIEQWGSRLFSDKPMQCDKPHDSASFGHSWMAGDKNAMSWTYPCGCSKKWIQKFGPRTTTVGEIEAKFTAAGNVELALGTNHITLQAADLHGFEEWLRNRRYDHKRAAESGSSEGGDR